MGLDFRAEPGNPACKHRSMHAHLHELHGGRGKVGWLPHLVPFHLWEWGSQPQSGSSWEAVAPLEIWKLIRKSSC